MAFLQMVRHRFWDNDNSLLAGGKVYIYEPGTTTPKNSYTDYTGTVPNAWPVILDAKGEAGIWVDGAFKINVLNSADAQVTGYPVDNINYLNDTSSKSDNPVINGAMEIDQRNAGAAVTVNSATETYTVDMVQARAIAAGGVFTAQQLAATPPAGFKNYIRSTVTTADASPISTSIYSLRIKIEGNNWSRFSYGTSDAKTTTLIFRARSSIAGVFSGAIRNSANNRSYAFQYTISSTNTWQTFGVTIPGDTTGTWLTDTGVGLNLFFDLGTGSNETGTAGSWQAAAYRGATGATKLISTLNATLDITGVDIVEGTQTRPYPHRTDGLERCQRYLPVIDIYATADRVAEGNISTTSAGFVHYKFKVTPRIPPTGITVSSAAHFNLQVMGISDSAATAITFNSASYEQCTLAVTGTGTPYTAGQAATLYGNNASGKIIFEGSQL